MGIIVILATMVIVMLLAYFIGVTDETKELKTCSSCKGKVNYLTYSFSSDSGSVCQSCAEKELKLQKI